MPETLGNRIKTLRSQREWSQLDLAHAADCEQTAISRIEVRKGYEPGAFLLFRVAKSLGVTLDDLLSPVLTFEPKAVQKNANAPASLVARLGEEVSAIGANQDKLAAAVGNIADALREIRSDIADLKEAKRAKAGRT